MIAPYEARARSTDPRQRRRVRAALATVAAFAWAACDEPPQEPAAVVLTQVVILYRSGKYPQADRTKEEARAFATSLHADLLAGRPIRDLLKFTGFVDKQGNPFHGGVFRLTKEGTVEQAFKDAAFSTPIGAVGPGPIETEVGFILFRREE